MPSTFIEFNLENSSNRIAVVLDEILFVKEQTGYTIIYVKNGDLIKVQQSYKQVFELINKAFIYA